MCCLVCVVWCALFGVCCLMYVVCCSLFGVCCLMLVRCLLFAIRYLWLVLHKRRFSFGVAVCCLVCRLCVDCYSLIVVCGLLFAGSCYLCLVCCSCMRFGCSFSLFASCSRLSAPDCRLIVVRVCGFLFVACCSLFGVGLYS